MATDALRGTGTALRGTGTALRGTGTALRAAMNLVHGFINGKSQLIK